MLTVVDNLPRTVTNFIVPAIAPSLGSRHTVANANATRTVTARSTAR